MKNAADGHPFSPKQLKDIAKTISGDVEKKAQVMDVLLHDRGCPDIKREKCRKLREEQREIRAERRALIMDAMGVER